MSALVFALRNNVFNFSRVLTEIRNISFESSSNNANVPPRPKRPLSSFMLFIKEKRKEMFDDYSKVRPVDQVKILSEKWRSLTHVEKQIYTDKYQESVKEYTKQNEAYMNSLTKEQRQAVLDELRIRKEQLRQKRFKSTLRKLNKPVGSRSPYNFFVIEKAAMTFGAKSTETMKKIGHEWKELSEEKKEIYRRKAEEDKKRYVSEMEKWTSKMLSEGHEDVLSQLNKKKRRRSNGTS
ncbi:transcription factor A, mitochondrial-like [Centruroides vittatus]|uniref:transcription factor A, mitochondrial-like n=1 Tax=Centruroides vittatus TaxID=120091 RepID=UPI00350F4200